MADELICNALGPHIVENLNTIAEMEWDAFRTMVHPWELDQYLSKY